MRRKRKISGRKISGRENQQGVIITLVAVFMLFVIGAMAALSIDVVTLYTARSEAQLAADAAALAGARVLANSGMTSDTTGVSSRAQRPLANASPFRSGSRAKSGEEPGRRQWRGGGGWLWRNSAEQPVYHRARAKNRYADILRAHLGNVCRSRWLHRPRRKLTILRARVLVGPRPRSHPCA